MIVLIAQHCLQDKLVIPSYLAYIAPGVQAFKTPSAPLPSKGKSTARHAVDASKLLRQRLLLGVSKAISVGCSGTNVRALWKCPAPR